MEDNVSSQDPLMGRDWSGVAQLRVCCLEGLVQDSCLDKWSHVFYGEFWLHYIYIYTKISMRVQQCVRFARYARSLSIIYLLCMIKVKIGWCT